MKPGAVERVAMRLGAAKASTNDMIEAFLSFPASPVNCFWRTLLVFMGFFSCRCYGSGGKRKHEKGGEPWIVEWGRVGAGVFDNDDQREKVGGERVFSEVDVQR